MADNVPLPAALTKGLSGLTSPESASVRQTDAGMSPSSVQSMVKVVVAKLPENILRLKLGGDLKGTALDVRPPENFRLTPHAQQQITVVKAQAAAQAVLMESVSASASKPLNSQAKEALTQAVLQALSDGKTRVNVPAQVTSVTPKAVSITLDVPGKPVISLPLSDSPLKVGDKLDIQLTVRSQGSGQLLLTPQAETRTSPLSLQVSRAVVQDVLSAALRQGVSLPADTALALPKSLQGLQNLPQGTGPLVQGQQIVRVDRHQVQLHQTITRAVATIPIEGGELPSMQSVSRQTPPGQLSPASLKGLPAMSLVSSKTSAAPGEIEKSVPQSSKTANDVSGLRQDKAVHESIINLSRQLLAQSGSPRQALTELLTILNRSPSTMHADTSSLTRQLASRITQELVGVSSSTAPATMAKGEPVAVNQPDPQRIAQSLNALFTAPTMPLSPGNITSVPPNNGFISGLVTMLQLSLAGKAMRQQPGLAKQADQADSLLSRTLSAATAGSTATPSRVATDLAQLDSRSQMMNQLKTLLNSHQQQKVNNADVRMQGQDSFYYVLPMAGEASSGAAEVLIKREDRQAKQSRDESDSQKQWNITMKLPVGDVGELLAKSRIRDEVIDLNLYTSSDPLLNRVRDTLPYLIRRLQSLGLVVEEAHCQRGKIPEHLSDRPYHIFETRV